MDQYLRNGSMGDTDPHSDKSCNEYYIDLIQGCISTKSQHPIK